MRIPRIVCLLAFAMALSGLAIAADEAKSAPKDKDKDIPDFDLQGISMTDCQCTAYACPCRSNGHPDHGSCDASAFTYIQHYHYGTAHMTGLNAVAVGTLIDHPTRTGACTLYFVKTSPSA